jgi:hypothetical protein
MSIFEKIMGPTFNTLQQIEQDYPNRTISVIVPELVGGSWYDYFLHNQFSTVLKAMLLMHGDKRITVINVPWYLKRD